MAQNVLPPSVGTTLKILVSADLGGGVHMDDVDFTCVFFRSEPRASQTVQKSEMIRIDQDKYIAEVATNVIGAGAYYIKFTAYIPDSDIKDGIREEVVTIPTGIKVTN